MGQDYQARQMRRPYLEPGRYCADHLDTWSIILPQMLNSLVLAAWMGVSLFGVVLGFGIAKYSQASGQEEFNPGAALGFVVVLASAALAVLATARYWIWGANLPGHSRAFGMFAICLIVAITWASLSIIAFSGWEVMLQQPRSLDQ